MVERFCRGTKITCELDNCVRFWHCHHEKTIVIDDRVAFVGGIDLTYDGGDPYDTPSTRPAAVSAGTTSRRACTRPDRRGRRRALPAALARVDGGGAAPAGRPGFRRRPRGAARADDSGGDLRAQPSAGRLLGCSSRTSARSAPPSASSTSRTSSCGRRRSSSSSRTSCATRRSDDFRIVLLLPVNANDGADVSRGQVATLIHADDGNGRFLACSVYARVGKLHDPVYVHAKLAIVDDRWLTVGSANLNEHSLFNDSEVNVVVHDEQLARETRLRLWSEHLELPIDELRDESPAETFDRHWVPVAEEQLERLRDGSHLTHRLVMLPGVSAKHRRILGALEGRLYDA